jgi:hypothetical protein
LIDILREKEIYEEIDFYFRHGIVESYEEIKKNEKNLICKPKKTLHSK